MHGKKLIVLIILIITLPIIIQGQEPPRIGSTEEGYSNIPEFAGIPLEIENKCTEFFKLIKAKRNKKAFEDLLEDSPISDRTSQVTNLIRASEQTTKFYGEMMGYEPVSSEVISNSLVRVRYIALHETYPMRWIFTYYKAPQGDWIIINIKFDDKIESFFSDETIY